MNFNIITLGCKVNQYESQAMREDMLKNGFLLSDDRDRADITIVNSSYGNIRKRSKKPQDSQPCPP